MADVDFDFDPGDQLEDDDLFYLTLKWFDGIEYELTVPSNGQLLSFSARSGSRSSARRLAGVLTLFEKIAPAELYAKMEDYLDNPHYPNSGDKILELFEWVIEKSTANPPTPPTASTGSSRSGGRSSTAGARRPASTRVRSTQGASSTSASTGS